MEQVPLVNGVRHAWASIRMNMLGRTVTGFTEIEYGEDRELTNNYGSGDQPVSRGRGPRKPFCKITLHSYEANAIRTAAGPGKGLLDIGPFDIVVTYLPEGSDGLVTDVIRNCEFMKDVKGGKQGDTVLTTGTDLLPSHISWGGGIAA